LVTDVVDATEASQVAHIGVVPSVQLGAATVDHLAVTFGDFTVFQTWKLTNEPALLIGMDALGTLSELTIDYRRKELHLLPHSHTASNDSTTLIAH
jgi:hypothetical protein